MATILAAVLAGLGVLVVLFPASGITPQPPVCFSVFGYVVPCDPWMAWVAGAATAGIVGAGIVWAGRRSTRTK